MSVHTRILGVGSPFGDDRIGWDAVAFIRASTWYRTRTAGTVSAVSLDRPGSALLAAMDGVSHAVLIDAMQSGAAPGTLRHIELDQLALSADSRASAHTLGLADALSLGKVLGLLPPRVTLLAVEGSHVGSDGSLSCEVRGALPAILRYVEACVTEGEGVLGAAPSFGGTRSHE